MRMRMRMRTGVWLEREGELHAQRGELMELEQGLGGAGYRLVLEYPPEH